MKTIVEAKTNLAREVFSGEPEVTMEEVERFVLHCRGRGINVFRVSDDLLKELFHEFRRLQ